MITPPQRFARLQKALWLVTAGTLAALAAGCRSVQAPSSKSTAQIKIGFLVKQPEEPWFQNEWKFAQEAADKYKFDLIKIGTPSGDKVLAAIDNLAAQGAQGFIICTPEVRLGPAIVAKARDDKLKVFSVDDRFVGADGKFMNVPYMGISAHDIGIMMGKALIEEMKHRQWKTADTAVCAMTFEELDTARQRTDGAIEALTKAGFPAAKIYKAPQKTSDVPGAFDASNIVLIQHPEVKNWLICGMNDEAVLGAVRATEGRSIPASRVIGVGIGGSTGMVDFEKSKPTGFFATVLIDPRRHGFETSEMMYKWIKDGTPPPQTTFTTGTLITRANYKEVMHKRGLL